MAPLETVSFGGEGVLVLILEGCKRSGPLPLVTLSLLPGGAQDGGVAFLV